MYRKGIEPSAKILSADSIANMAKHASPAIEIPQRTVYGGWAVWRSPLPTVFVEYCTYHDLIRLGHTR